MICEVIVDIAHSEVDRIFDYVCDQPVQAGARVAVPFGRSAATGFIMRVKEHSDFPAERLKKVYRVEAGTPAINAECLGLARAIAARYRVPLALCLRLFIPPEMRTGKVSETYRTFARFMADVSVKNAPQQAACLAFLKENGEADAALLRAQFGAGAVGALVKKGAVALESGACCAILIRAWREGRRSMRSRPPNSAPYRRSAQRIRRSLCCTA